MVMGTAFENWPEGEITRTILVGRLLTGSGSKSIATARPEVPEPQRRIYDRIAIKPGHPVCVTVNGGKCGGCHLKVPTHIEVMARTGSEIATCDQCSRVVYWQS